MDAKQLMTLRILFAGIQAGPIIFIVVILTTFQGKPLPLMPEDNLFLMLSVALSSAMIIASFMFYRMRLPGIRAQTGATEKFAAWQTMFIVRLAMLEAPALFSAVCLLLTEANIFIIIVGALTGIQLLNFPTARGIENDTTGS